MIEGDNKPVFPLILQFFACLLIIFGAEITAGVFGFMNKEQVWSWIIVQLKVINKNIFVFIIIIF